MRILESTRELLAAEYAWDDLWEHSDVTAPSARARVIALWADNFAPSAAFRALTVESEGQLLAALPLTGGRFLSLFSTGQLPCNVWAASGSLLLRPDVEVVPVLDELVRGLSLLPWRQLVLERVAYESPSWVAFWSALERAGVFTRIVDQHRVGEVEIADSWDEYEASRKARHRQRRRRNARMLEKTGKTELKVYRSLAERDVDRLMRLGFEVEARSWKGAAGTAVMDNPEILEYYLAEAQQVAAWQQLELVFLELDERPIAYCYGWNAKGVRFCVKIGFDEAFAKYGPGQQLIFRLLERAHDEPESRLYDFHGRMVPWTESWITRSYPVGRVLIVSRGAAGRSLFRAYARLHPLLKAARAKFRSG